jgi:hypothetical protein
MRTLVPAIALAAVLGWTATAAAQDRPAQPASPPAPAQSHDAAMPAMPSPQMQTPAPAAPKPQVQTQAPQAAPKPEQRAHTPPPPPQRAQMPPPVPPPPGMPPPPPAERYSFHRVDDGFLRFDHVTGHIAYCSARSGGWACQAVPENRAALENEVAHLQDVVAALQKEVEALREPPPPRPPAPIPPPAAAPPAPTPPAATPDKDTGIKLPSEQDMARARAYIEETWRRLVDMIDQLQRDMMRKRDGDTGLSRT